MLIKVVFVKIIGGVFLLYLAYKEIRSEQSDEVATITSEKLILKVFFLTLTNPMTILSFIGIFASIGNGPTSVSESLTMVVGIFIDSMTWWLVLGGIILKIKHKLPVVWVHRIRYLSALILGGFGAIAIIGGISIL